jgi:hypothetical protein
MRFLNETKKEKMCPCCDAPEEKCKCDADCEDCNCKNKGKNKNESYGFDKFMDSILLSENKKNKLKCEADSAQRERARRNQERPLHRIKMVNYE